RQVFLHQQRQDFSALERNTTNRYRRSAIWRHGKHIPVSQRTPPAQSKPGSSTGCMARSQGVYGVDAKRLLLDQLQTGAWTLTEAVKDLDDAEFFLPHGSETAAWFFVTSRVTRTGRGAPKTTLYGRWVAAHCPGGTSLRIA